MEKELVNKFYEKAKELNAEFFNDGFVIKNGDRKGTIKYFQPNYVEIEISDHNGETIFYQQMEDIKELENELIDVLKNFHNSLFGDISKSQEDSTIKQPKLYDFHDGKGYRLPKILISCTSGGTSYIYANLLKTRMMNHGIDLDVEALDIESAKERVDDYDAIMLAPQVSYYHDELRSKYGEKIMKIPSSRFSSMNTSDYEKYLTLDEDSQ